MKRIKKIITTLIITLSIFAFSTINTEAATGSISITSNKSNVVVGDSVKFTVKVSSPKGMAALQYNISYNSSMLNLTKGNSSDAPVFSGNGATSATYTFTFKAKKSGTASMTFNAVGATMVGDEEVKFTSKSKSVKIITQAELEASYSSNNKLSSLAVEGYSLSPNFSSTVTSYTVNLPANTETINISGKKADSKASVEGLGKKSVEDGTNTIKIVVTAENGSTKTYTINAIVEELDPIHVTVDNEEYTVVRKAKLLEAPNSDFIPGTTTIEENEVPTLFNEKANLTLIGLKNEAGEIKLYIYNQNENTYKEYNQFTFPELTLYIVDKEVENNEGKKEVTINDKNVIVYKLDDNYYYFYGLNLSSGKENLYRYDKEENTIQKEIIEKEEVIIPEEKNNEDLYKIIIIGLLGFIFLTYIIILIVLLIKGRNKNKKENITSTPIIEKIPTKEELSIEEKEIHEEIEKIGTQELKLRDLNNKKENKVSSLEKEKLIRESEEELNRITTENIDEENEITEVINEVFEEEPKKKKGKSKKSKKKKD